MRRLLSRLTSAVIAAAALIGLAGVFAGNAHHAVQLCVAVLIATAAWRPAEALLLLAGIGPLAGALGAILPSPDGWTVPLTLAAAAGYAIRSTRAKVDDPDRPLTAASAAWLVVVLVSLGSLSLGQGHGVLARIGDWAAARFLLRDNVQFPGVASAAIAIGGVAAYMMTARECVRRPDLGVRVLRLLLYSMAAVGLLNVYRLVEIALRRPPFPASLLAVHEWARISVTFPDPNAAGAFFLLGLPPALFGVRDRRFRLTAAITLPFLLAGLWLSGSRTALIVFALTLAIVALLAPARGRRWRKVLAPASVVAGALALAWFYPRVPSTGDAGIAFGVRREMAAATVRMLQQHPLAGVGIGQYYQVSPDFMSSLMKTWYPAQNAHNQLLQVAGELGLPGLLVFTVLVGMGVIPISLAAWSHRDPYEAGLAFGALAFLASSLTMHPLLIPEVSLAFWIVLGLCRSTRAVSSDLGPRAASLVSHLLYVPAPAAAEKKRSPVP
jgi:O-antigen ligase